MLRPGAERGRRSGRPAPASPAGTATCSPTRAASRCSRSTPTVDDDGVTFRSDLRRLHPPPDAGDGGGRPGAARRRHPDGARRVPGAARRRRRGGPPGRRAHRWRGPAGPARAHRPARTRRCSASCRAASTPTCGPRAPRATGRARLRRLRHRRPVGRRAARRDAAGAGRRHRRAAGRPAPLPDGGRRPGRARRGGRRSASTCSTACCRPASGRHGTALTDAGRLQLAGRRHARDDDSPVDPACGCPVCGRYSRAYLRHLFMVGEPTAGRLLTIHNLAWILALMARTPNRGQGRYA